jgi:hypothetical protein
VGTARQVVTAFTAMIMLYFNHIIQHFVLALGSVVNEITARSLSACITSLRLNVENMF